MNKPTHYEPHHAKQLGSRSNWLRAAVLGSNDGIVSIAGLVVGVAGATNSKLIILAAGVAGILAGALSMAAGEYVSVSTQRDIEKSLLHKEREELNNQPDEELDELVGLYEAKGLKHSTARMVANELTAKDAFAAHVDAELNIDPNNLTNAWHAAYASAIAFFIGSVIPLVFVMLPIGSLTIPVTFLSVVVALTVTGYLSAKLAGTAILKSILRVVIGGALAMIITYTIGTLFGVSHL
ncbi:VIT family protein [Patescibacteria group bacterium]|nr:MAG: VIT family protein [Patescibacteria group bacterium]